MIEVKPSDFKSTCFIGTPLQNCECELVCGNIVTISGRLWDRFLPFTWETYVATCDHTPGWKEKDTLGELIERGLLTLHGDEYHITPKFFATLADYIFRNDAPQRGYGEDGVTEKV